MASNRTLTRVLTATAYLSVLLLLQSLILFKVLHSKRKRNVPSPFFNQPLFHQTSAALFQVAAQEHERLADADETKLPNMRPLIVDPNGYLAFLPHSGLNNQRIELENALLLAHILNRTLILPPAYLGHLPKFSWAPFRVMLQVIRHIEQTPSRLRISRPTYDFEDSNFMIPWSTLFDLRQLPDSIRTISMADFVRLGGVLKSGDDIMLLEDNERYAYRWFDKLPGGDDGFFVDNLTNDLLPSQVFSANSHSRKPDRWFQLETTLCHSENTLYMICKSGFIGDEGNLTNSATIRKLEIPNNGDWDKYESQGAPDCEKLMPLSPVSLKLINKNKKTPALFRQFLKRFLQVPMSKFSHFLNAAAIRSDRNLGKLPKLVFAGSLFGSDLVHLFESSNLEIRRRIQRATSLAQPALLAIVEKISRYLGGPGAFAALHIRGSDGVFAKQLSQTLSNVGKIIDNWTDRSKNSSTFSTVFLATDSPSRVASFMKIFTGRIQKIFTIADFMDEIKLLDTQLTIVKREALKLYGESGEWSGKMAWLFDSVEDAMGPLKIISTAEEQVLRARHFEFQVTPPADTDDISDFTRLWVSFVEQMVCSRAWGVIGTKGSTFTQYIRRLYEIYWADKGRKEGLRFEYA